LLPHEFYDLEFEEYILLRKGYIEKIKTESYLLRFQTALICEAFVGKGNGTRFVMESWQLEEKTEITSSDIKKLLKAKKERETLRRLKKEKNG
jgi:hypothetical protein